MLSFLQILYWIWGYFHKQTIDCDYLQTKVMIGAWKNSISLLHSSFHEKNILKSTLLYTLEGI